MATRLGDMVLYGELRNLRNYSTHGILVLRGTEPEEEVQLRFELTGNCDEDLKGKCIRFWPANEEAPECFDEKAQRGFQLSQVGATGTMTSQGWVRALPCSVKEYIRRCELGEPPPTPWKDRLYLEWFGQNGRVVIEMAGAVVEEQIRAPEGEDDEGDWKVLPNLAIPPYLVEGEAPTEPEIVVVRWEDQDPEPPPEVAPEVYARMAEIEEEDPLYSTRIMDDCVENKEGDPVSDVLGPAADLPPPETLSDDEIEGRFLAAVGHLALYGIALDVCEHFTPRQCYEWLRDVVLPERTVHPEMFGTGWVQHICTFDDCPACEEQALKDYEDFSPE